MRINLTPYEKWQVIWDEIIIAFAMIALMGGGLILSIALWVIYKPQIKAWLLTVQNLMSG